MKKPVYLAVGLAALLLAVHLGGSFFTNRKIDRLIEEANHDGNHFSIGGRDLSFGPFNVDVAFDDVKMDQPRGPFRFTGTVDHVDIQGLSVMKVLSGEVSISEVLVKGAALELHPLPEKPDTAALVQNEKIKPFVIRELRIDDGRLALYDEADKLTAEILGLAASASLVLPLAPATPPKISLTADSLHFPDMDAAKTINDLELDTELQTLRIGTARISPRQTVRSYLTSIAHKDTWQALRIDGLEATDVPFDSLFAKAPTVLPNVTIGDFNLDVFENPSLEKPPKEHRKLFPVEAFRNLSRPFLLRSLTVARANIAYGVHKEDAAKPDITFAGTIRAGNFSTWRQDAPAFAEADFMFEGDSPLNVRFELDQAGDGRDFSVTGQLEDYELTEINPLLLLAAGADVESGHVDRMTHDFSVTNGVASGKLVLEYHDLELKMQGKKSWLINILEDVVIRDSNPRNDGDLVIGRVNAEHDPTRSFFNLYWKSLVSGMKSCVAGKSFLPEELDPLQ